MCSLKDEFHMRKKKKLKYAEEEILYFLATMNKAVHSLGELLVYHCYINPSHILIDNNRRYKLCSLGYEALFEE